MIISRKNLPEGKYFQLVAMCLFHKYRFIQLRFHYIIFKGRIIYFYVS